MAESHSEFDPLVDQVPSRFVVGIDLGTTNCAVAYVDTKKTDWCVEVFPVPQLVAPAEVESRETLPSFHYEPVPSDSSADALRLPWTKSGKQKASAKKTGKPKDKSSEGSPVKNYAVGVMARDEGTLAPGRMIASAKSWLCHTGVDRTADLLPWHGAADVQRLSPVDVSARYLQHIHDAWNKKFPRAPLSEQDLVITLPASFDEIARELTIAAAARANLNRVVLVEEPQAAFYAWIYKHAKDWHKQVTPGQNVLVCDIGGGTSDFTLIRVRQADLGKGKRRKAQDKVQFHRVAVGDHLILGGDNLDLTLAQRIEEKLTKGGKLQPRQWGVLVNSCRHVKETLLGEEAPEQFTVNLPGEGSKVIGGSLRATVTRKEVEKLLVDGFLPPTKLKDQPEQRRSGFQEFGLPYAPDAAITRYLAAFLTAHRDVAEGDDSSRSAARPDVILLNGGFFASPQLRQRLLDVVTSWFRKTKKDPWEPLVLDNDRLDLAVARGAAYYGMVRRGEGVRINANLARSYYINVAGESPAAASNDGAPAATASAMAVCLVPGDAQPGSDVEPIDRRFELLVSQPVEFPLFVSSTRLTDKPGQLIPLDPEQMSPLPPIRTVLQARRRRQAESLPVQLHARLTEIGTIDLWCSEEGSQRSWRLQFDIRSTTQTDLAAHEAHGESAGIIDESSWNACYDLIEGVFSPSGQLPADGLMKKLSKSLGGDRQKWPPSLLRRMWDALMTFDQGRRRSPVHEARWLNLLGYSLRPGYGVAVDDWRVAETWRTVRGKLAHHTPPCRNESLILWRRISGGLSTGQQVAIAEPLIAPLRGLHARFYGTGNKKKGAGSSFDANESIEAWRLLGSLELLSIKLKIDLGKMICQLLTRRKLSTAHPAMVWALGRLGQRVPAYGPLNTVVPSSCVEEWVAFLMELGCGDPIYQLALMQLARRTDDRYRDLSAPVRQQAADCLRDQQAKSHLIELVEQGGRLDAQEQGQVFGESLPMGLRLHNA